MVQGMGSDLQHNRWRCWSTHFDDVIRIVCVELGFSPRGCVGGAASHRSICRLRGNLRCRQDEGCISWLIANSLDVHNGEMKGA